jgi:uncharacterized protein (DUF2267 family)
MAASFLLEPTVGLITGWLAEIASRTGCSDAVSFAVLRAVLHALRDPLSDEAGSVVAQDLPVLVRGLWYEGWQPSGARVAEATMADWLVTLEGHLLAADADAVPPGDAAAAVFALLGRHLGRASRRGIDRELPRDMAALFPKT